MLAGRCEAYLTSPAVISTKEGRHVNRIAIAGLSMVLAAGITLSLTACGGAGAPSGPSSLNLAGTWTVKAVSTQGHGTSSGTAAVSQSGQGLGVNGSTTLAAPIGGMTVSQTGTALTGTITNSMKAATFNFTGTLFSGALTITGSTSCGVNSTQTLSMTATLASNAAQGTYTVSHTANCYSSTDAGTFTATKQ